MRFFFCLTSPDSALTQAASENAFLDPGERRYRLLQAIAENSGLLSEQSSSEDDSDDDATEIEDAENLRSSDSSENSEQSEDSDESEDSAADVLGVDHVDMAVTKTPDAPSTGRLLTSQERFGEVSRWFSGPPPIWSATPDRHYNTFEGRIQCACPTFES